MIGPTVEPWYSDGEEHRGCVIVEFPTGWGPLSTAPHWQVQWHPLFRVFETFQQALDWAVGQQFEEIEFKFAAKPAA